MLLVLPFLNESESLVAAILLCKLLKRGPGKERVTKAWLGAGRWALGTKHRPSLGGGQLLPPDPLLAARRGGGGAWAFEELGR